jgi:hypothetical protein
MKIGPCRKSGRPNRVAGDLNPPAPTTLPLKRDLRPACGSTTGISFGHAPGVSQSLSGRPQSPLQAMAGQVSWIVNPPSLRTTAGQVSFSVPTRCLVGAKRILSSGRSRQSCCQANFHGRGAD